MEGGVRRLRKPVERGAFQYRRVRLTERQVEAVRAVVNELRKEESLPGDQDIPDLLEPALHCFARPVPGFSLWVCYSFSDVRLELLAIKTQLLVPL